MPPPLTAACLGAAAHVQPIETMHYEIPREATKKRNKTSKSDQFFNNRPVHLFMAWPASGLPVARPGHLFIAVMLPRALAPAPVTASALRPREEVSTRPAGRALSMTPGLQSRGTVNFPLDFARRNRHWWPRDSLGRDKNN